MTLILLMVFILFLLKILKIWPVSWAWVFAPLLLILLIFLSCILFFLINIVIYFAIEYDYLGRQIYNFFFK